MSHTVKNRGLYTNYNELEIPEGGMVVADNVNIDSDNVVTPRRGFSEYGTEIANSKKAKQLIDYKSRLIRHQETKLEYDNGSGTFTAFDGDYTSASDPLRIKSLEAKGNLYFTTNNGVKKLSARSAADFNSNVGLIVDSGAARAVDLNAVPIYETGGFLPSQSKVGYFLVWFYVDLNNNIIYGAPSARFVLDNALSNAQIKQSSTITVGGVISNADYITLSSPSADYFIWFDTTGSETAPAAPASVGKSLIEVDLTGTTTNDQRATKIAQALLLVDDFDVTIASNVVTVTCKEAGETTVIVESTANITVATLTFGDDSEASAANVTLNFTIPSEITSTSYAYQIYRTPVVTIPEGLNLTLSDIDPDNNANLVIESQISDAELAAGEITVVDNTPETFRAQGAILYTSPSLGQGGILNANYKPPIATDIAMFRDHMFYANTKTRHNYYFDILSVDDFISGSTSIIIGNEDRFDEYSFVGSKEVTPITADTFANTTENGYLKLYSANDERKYLFWMNKNVAPVAPTAAGFIITEVDISGVTTADAVAGRLRSAILLTGDFTASSVSSGTFSVTCVKNGTATDATLTSLTGAWAIGTITQGTGEDTLTQQCLLQDGGSTSQNIDETARSFVKCINRNPDSIVNAFYISTSNDLPGKIYLEARSIVDISFFVGVSGASGIGAEFNPTLAEVDTITAISLANPTVITSNSHGLSNKNDIYIFDTNSTPALLGQYTISSVTPNTFTVPVDVTVAGTSGFFFKATNISTNDEKTNRLYWSKRSEPEAVPVGNFRDIGAQDKAILRIVALRDALFVLKEDGLYIITSTSSPFTDRLIDGTVSLVAADSVVALDNKLYGLFDSGIVSIDGSGGTGSVSWVIEDLIKDITNISSVYKTKAFGVAYENDRSYNIFLPSPTSADNTQSYRYNTFTQTWTHWTVPATCGLVFSNDDKLYLGSAESSYLWQERKTNTRYDYADVSFIRNLNAGFNIADKTLLLSSNVNIKEGYAIYQTQYLTAYQVNKLLRKLDLDGAFGTDYYSQFVVTNNINLPITMQAINDELIANDTTSTITDHSPYSTNFVTLQEQFNDLIAEINDASSPARFKDYSTSTGSTHYEAIVDDILKGNQILVNTNQPFMVGDITVLKCIESIIQWAPQSFDSPESLKQISEGSILFDGNNFYRAKIAYSSDLSSNFQYSYFYGYTAGAFGDFKFGDTTFGGEGNDAPARKLVPRQKQKCRYINVRFEFCSALNQFKIIGLSLEARQMSTKAYRGKVRR